METFTALNDEFQSVTVTYKLFVIPPSFFYKFEEGGNNL